MATHIRVITNSLDEKSELFLKLSQASVFGPFPISFAQNLSLPKICLFPKICHPTKCAASQSV